jgi:hypothetical protein
MADTEQNLKTYRGNCHCGAFVFEADLPADMTETNECNCTICSKKAYLFAVPAPGSFKMVKGDEKDLSVYTFGPATRPHYVSTGLLSTRVEWTCANCPLSSARNVGRGCWHEVTPRCLRLSSTYVVERLLSPRGLSNLS